jgi:hypothetical protein
MTTVTFDTLKYAEALKTAGVPDAQAEALAEALRQGGQDLPTKADIAELKAELRADIAKLQTDIAWIKWIITGGVGLYVLRSIVEWLSVTRAPRWAGDSVSTSTTSPCGDPSRPAGRIGSRSAVG